MPARSVKRNYDYNSTVWMGGPQTTHCREQFQTLYQEVGFEMARELAEQLVLWPSKARPPEDLYFRWALEVDEGKHEIRDSVAKAFRLRFDNFIKNVGIRTVAASAKASQTFARLLAHALQKAEKGEIDEPLLKMLSENSSNFMHANNGVGFITREVVKAGQNGPTMQFAGGLTINAGPPPKQRQLPKARPIVRALKEPVMDADFSVVS